MAALAAPAVGGAAPASLRFLQCMDPAPEAQEHVRDYAAGLQLALQSSRRGARVPVEAVQMPCDGSPTSVAHVAQRLSDDRGLLALAGATTERVSMGCLQHLNKGAAAVAHLVPWLPDPRLDHLGHVVNLFASRDELVRQSITALKSIGFSRLGVVYDSQATRDFLETSIVRALNAARVQAPAWAPASGTAIEELVASLPVDAPMVLAFAGGAIELSRFMRAVANRSESRVVLSLTGVDLGLIQQLGVARAQSLLLASPVPNPMQVTLPVVTQFRLAHARLYDDTPTPSALAGYIAGRYLLRLADQLPSSPTRQQVLDEVSQRRAVSLEGYDVAFMQGSNRASQFVALTMLTRDGRLIGHEGRGAEGAEDVWAATSIAQRLRSPAV